MRPFLTAALYIAFVLAVAAVALSAQSDASRALPTSTAPRIAALMSNEPGVSLQYPTPDPSNVGAEAPIEPSGVPSAAPTTCPGSSVGRAPTPCASEVAGSTPVRGSIVGSDEPSASPVVSARPTSLPRIQTGMIVGVATHYWNGAGYYAAAGPGLRRAIGPDWRNHAVVVTAFVNGQARSVSLELTDWCLCTRTADRIIDLSDDAFAHICGALGVGVCRVEVQWAVQ